VRGILLEGEQPRALGGAEGDGRPQLGLVEVEQPAGGRSGPDRAGHAAEVEPPVDGRLHPHPHADPDLDVEAGHDRGQQVRAAAVLAQFGRGQHGRVGAGGGVHVVQLDVVPADAVDQGGLVRPGPAADADHGARTPRIQRIGGHRRLDRVLAAGGEQDADGVGEHDRRLSEHRARDRARPEGEDVVRNDAGRVLHCLSCHSQRVDRQIVNSQQSASRELSIATNLR
jgi:hypothetical protein